METKIVKCPECGRIQVTYANIKLLCKFCGARRSMRRLKILAKTDDFNKAVVLCKYFETKDKKPQYIQYKV